MSARVPRDSKRKKGTFHPLPTSVPHPGAAHVQSTVEMPKSVAEALAEMAEDEEELDEEDDEEFGEDSELDELYERLETKPNPYSQLRAACKLIFVASAQDRITQIGQTFGNQGGTLPAIVNSFATCPDSVAKDLRALLDRTIQQFFRDRGILPNEQSHHASSILAPR